MTKAWIDASAFYDILIQSVQESCETLIIAYVKGNHDEALSWTFTQYMKAKYPQVVFDVEYRERKAFLMGTNFIGLTHGDKGKRLDYPSMFSVAYPMEWAKSTNKDILIGHLHHEKVIDVGGAVIRQMSTAAKVDDWHNDNGYMTAHKRFMALCYTHDKLKQINYY